MWLRADQVAALVARHEVARELAGKRVFWAWDDCYLEWDGTEFVAIVVLDPPVRVEGGDGVWYEGSVWCIQDLYESRVIVSDRSKFLSVHASRWCHLRPL